MTRTLVWLLLCAPAALGIQETSSIPAEKLAGEDRLEDVMQHVDPSLEGWNTELLSDQAQKCIEELAHATFVASVIGPDELPNFVVDDVSSTRLRPEALDLLRNTLELRVARGTIDGELRTGRAALAASLSDLWKAQGTSAEPHIKI